MMLHGILMYGRLGPEVIPVQVPRSLMADKDSTSDAESSTAEEPDLRRPAEPAGPPPPAPADVEVVEPSRPAVLKSAEPDRRREERPEGRGRRNGSGLDCLMVYGDSRCGLNCPKPKTYAFRDYAIRDHLKALLIVFGKGHPS